MSDGFSLRSYPWSLDATSAGGRKGISDSRGRGFAIVADPRNRGAYPLKVCGYGPNGRGNQELWVVDNSWHTVDFQKLEVIALETNMPGDWFTQISDDPDLKTKINPGTPPVNVADLPAQIGGLTAPRAAPTLRASQIFTEAQALTRAAPDNVSLGQAIAGNSMLFVSVLGAGGANITGGAIDVWKYDTVSAAWELWLQGIAIPTGASRVAVPVIPLDVKNYSDRVLACASAITGPASVTMYQRIQ